MPRVLCAGHINWDVTLRVDTLPKPDGEARLRSQYQSGGGSAANVATALAALGIQAGVLGSVGDDEHGRAARRSLREHGVETDPITIIPDRPTTVKYLIVEAASDGQVMVLGNEGANEAIEPADITESTVRDFDHLHLTGQRPATAAALAEHATTTDITVSVDPGRRLGDRDYETALDVADIVFLNERETDCLPNPGDVGADGTFDETTVVCKDGKRGATVYTAEGSYHHDGYTVDTVDTAGAGDAFAAGFLAVVLEHRENGDIDHERCLEVANACGALATTVEGAQISFEPRAIEEVLD
ncbi:MAG: carbohydrate kinase family protein [Halobacteriales archaeon]